MSLADSRDMFSIHLGFHPHDTRCIHQRSRPEEGGGLSSGFAFLPLCTYVFVSVLLPALLLFNWSIYFDILLLRKAFALLTSCGSFPIIPTWEGIHYNTRFFFLVSLGFVSSVFLLDVCWRLWYSLYCCLWIYQHYNIPIFVWVIHYDSAV